MLVHFLEDVNDFDLDAVYAIEDTSGLKDTVIRLRENLSTLDADFIGVEVSNQVYSLNNPVMKVLGEEDYDLWLDCHLDGALLDIEDKFLDYARADICHLVVGRTYARIAVVLKYGERLELEIRHACTLPR